MMGLGLWSAVCKQVFYLCYCSANPHPIFYEIHHIEESADVSGTQYNLRFMGTTHILRQAVAFTAWRGTVLGALQGLGGGTAGL